MNNDCIFADYEKELLDTIEALWKVADAAGVFLNKLGDKSDITLELKEMKDSLAALRQQSTDKSP